MAFTSKSERVLDFGIPKHILTPASALLMRELANQSVDGREEPLAAIDLKRKLQNLKSYEPTHKEYSVDPAKAPFNSSVARTVGGDDKYLPGPGIYEHDVGFDAIKKKKESLMHAIL